MTQQEFAALIQRAIDAGKITQIANEYEVAESTVKRWASGIANPHPRLKKMIADYIKSCEVD